MKRKDRIDVCIFSSILTGLSGGGFVYYEGFNLGYLLFGMTLGFCMVFGWNWGSLTQEIILREWNE